MDKTISRHFATLRPVSFKEFGIKYPEAHQNLVDQGVHFGVSGRKIGFGPTPQGTYWRLDDETGEEIEAMPPLDALQYWDDEGGDDSTMISVWDPNLKTYMYVEL